MFDNVFKVIWLVGLIAGSVVRVLYARPHKKDSIRVDRQSRMDTLLMLLPTLGMLVLPLVYVLSDWLDFADYRLPAWAGWVGATVLAAAIGLLWMTHVALGLNWSPTLQVRKEHSLITHGVYRRVRHPMYAAHCLWGIAQVLLLQNWIAGPSMLVSSIPLFLLRIPREEQMLLEHFGQEYRLYMNRTGRIIPRFWR